MSKILFEKISTSKKLIIDFLINKLVQIIFDRWNK